MRTGARFVVGIDLGTTNSALAWADPHASAPAVELLSIDQLVAPGEVAARPLLPSFLYLASESEFPEGALDLPWEKERTWAVGELARAHGFQVPMRLVSSAKSWLSHAGVDRTAPILPPYPPGADPSSLPGGLERVSPLEAQARYLAHLRAAWDARMARGDESARLERQDVYLTVPASFDAVARELTVRAATAAGLEVTLLEEPQAAFYSWLGRHGDGWRKQLHVGDVVLVCDVGGGTTDFSLIAVTDDGSGNLALERIAVGEHILLGGDNIDLALGQLALGQLAEGGVKLDAWQQRALTHACRAAKEALLGESPPESHPAVVLGRGRSVVGGSIRTDLAAGAVRALVLDGFFPACAEGESPRARKRGSLQELGLPYAADPAVTRHLAKFLSDHRAATCVLFNGGVMKAPALRRRIVETLDSWSDDPEADLTVLDGTDLDLAVAHGAAYYGLVQRGRGIRIRGGTARSYYIGIESSMPAVPGLAPPLKAICVAPRGTEQGTTCDVAGEELGLVVGEPAEFRFLASTTREGDRVGQVIDDLDGIEENAPIEVELLPGPGAPAGQLVPVTLRAAVTEVGTVEVWCTGRDGGRWKLEFDVRGADAGPPR